MIETLLPQDNPENIACHDICSSLSKQFSKGEITLKDLEKEVAYVALKYGFDDIKLRYTPERISEMIEYDELSSMEKINLKTDYWQQENIKKYIYLCKIVKNENQANIEWLNKLLTFLPEEDLESRQKILDKLGKFGYTEEVKSALNVFEGNLINQERSYK
jgi:hypothetical protein